MGPHTLLNLKSSDKSCVAGQAKMVHRRPRLKDSRVGPTSRERCNGSITLQLIPLSQNQNTQNSKCIQCEHDSYFNLSPFSRSLASALGVEQAKMNFSSSV